MNIVLPISETMKLKITGLINFSTITLGLLSIQKIMEISS